MPENSWLDLVRFGPDGLVPVVAQESRSGAVLMVAWANREALERTRSSGRAHYFSRSRAALWQKGETSGHVQDVREIRLDCDADAVLYRVRQDGPACHTGTPSCFATVVAANGDAEPAADGTGPTLERLAATVARRAGAGSDESYTARLLARGLPKVAQKLGEEAVEVVVAATAEDDARVASEAADLLYHLVTLLQARNVPLQRVWDELERREK